MRWVYNRSPQPVSHMGYGAFMSSEISQRELRNNSGDIMRRLDEGEAFIVTRNGVPVGELVPLRRRRVVNGPALAAAFRDTSVVIDLDVIAPDATTRVVGGDANDFLSLEQLLTIVAV